MRVGSSSSPCEGVVLRGAVQDRAHQREAVAVQAAGGQGDEGVAGAHALGAEQRVALDHADAEAREVERARQHRAGVLGGLAAQQRAADLLAGPGDRGDQARDDVGSRRSIAT